MDKPLDGKLERGVQKLPEWVCRKVRERRVGLRRDVKALEDLDREDEMAEERRNRLVLPKEFDEEICVSEHEQRPRWRTFQAIVSAMEVMMA